MPEALPERQPAKHPYKRSPLHFLQIIHPRFQITVLGIFILFVGEVIAVAVWSAISAKTDLAIILGQSDAHLPVDLIEQALRRRFMSFLSVSIVLTAFHAVMWMVISNRVAGPIVRLRNTLVKRAGGDPAKNSIKFRDGDYFEDLPDIIENLITKSEHGKGAGHEDK
jgi:hypothetical protein